MLTLVLAAALVACGQMPQAQPESLEALRAAVARNPYDGRPEERLAFALNDAGEREAACVAFERTVELAGPGWGQLYNVACLKADLGRDDEALDWLERSLKAGLPDDGVILREHDFERLHDLPRFRALTGLYPPEGLTRDERWRYDLAFLKPRMERMHWDLYAHVSEADFTRELEALSSAVPELSEGQIRARLAHLMARVGDGHTRMLTYPEGAASVQRFPLDLYLFHDGLYVCGAPKAYEALIGGRVFALGDVPVERALEGMRAYVSVDNDMGYREWVPYALTSPDVLEALGAVVADEPLDLGIVRADGSRERTFVESVAQPPAASSGLGTFGRKRAADMLYAVDSTSGELPLYLRDAHRPLWFTDLPEQHLVYFWFGAVDDPPGGTFEGFCKELFDHIEAVHAERLVIDMRLNDGGNTGVVLPLIHGLVRCDAVNAPGHLFVITSRTTFSAAMNTCSLLELHTKSTFVGEPTGSRPNFVGESTSFLLPCTRYRVFCSSRYWQHVSSTDKRPWIAPAIVAEPDFADYAARRDPVMDAILAQLR